MFSSQTKLFPAGEHMRFYQASCNKTCLKSNMPTWSEKQNINSKKVQQLWLNYTKIVPSTWYWKYWSYLLCDPIMMFFSFSHTHSLTPTHIQCNSMALKTVLLFSCRFILRNCLPPRYVPNTRKTHYDIFSLYFLVKRELHKINYCGSILIIK